MEQTGPDSVETAGEDHEDAFHFGTRIRGFRKALGWSLEPVADANRIGLSMGGYCAPRAAAMEKRLKCVASLGAFYELDANWEAILRGDTGTGLSDGLPESGMHAMHVTNTDTIDDAVAVLKSRTWEPVIDRITCPLLVVHGENDRQVALAHAHKTVAGAVDSSDAQLRVLSVAEVSTEHCGVDVMKMQGEYVYDWAARPLRGHVA